MASSVKDMLAAANSAVPRIQPADLRDRMSKGDVVVVDVRDAPELATGGKIKGAVHVPRGMLEFRADPESPYHNPALSKEKTADPPDVSGEDPPTPEYRQSCRPADAADHAPQRPGR